MIVGRLIFIPIDNYLDKLHNKGSIDGEFEAWLTFLGCDEPQYIIRLIEEYPYFKRLYNDLYNMCLNVERVMEMFSEELKILDQNTVKYVIDELQEEVDAANATIAEKDAEIAQKDELIRILKSKLKEQENTKK